MFIRNAAITLFSICFFEGSLAAMDSKGPLRAHGQTAGQNRGARQTAVLSAKDILMVPLRNYLNGHVKIDSAEEYLKKYIPLLKNYLAATSDRFERDFSQRGCNDRKKILMLCKVLVKDDLITNFGQKASKFLGALEGQFFFQGTSLYVSTLITFLENEDKHDYFVIIEKKKCEDRGENFKPSESNKERMDTTLPCMYKDLYFDLFCLLICTFRDYLQTIKSHAVFFRKFYDLAQEMDDFATIDLDVKRAMRGLRNYLVFTQHPAMDGVINELDCSQQRMIIIDLLNKAIGVVGNSSKNASGKEKLSPLILMEATREAQAPILTMMGNYSNNVLGCMRVFYKEAAGTFLSPKFRDALENLSRQTHCLHHSDAYLPYQLARLEEQIVAPLFDTLIKELLSWMTRRNDDAEVKCLQFYRLLQLINIQLTHTHNQLIREKITLKRQSYLSKLQQYLSKSVLKENDAPPEDWTEFTSTFCTDVIGDSWELMVSLSLLRRNQLADVNFYLFREDGFHREFDIKFRETQMVRCIAECKALKDWFNETELDTFEKETYDKKNPSKGIILLQQFKDQKDLAAQHGCQFVLISKKEIPKIVKSWFKKDNANCFFIDPGYPILRIGGEFVHSFENLYSLLGDRRYNRGEKLAKIKDF